MFFIKFYIYRDFVYFYYFRKVYSFSYIKLFKFFFVLFFLRYFIKLVIEKELYINLVLEREKIEIREIVIFYF